MNKYMSVITNFGCHYKCPYCIVKNTGMDIPETTVEGLDNLVESIRKHDCDWVSVSGGGDPLHGIYEHFDWWYKFFAIMPLGVFLELHTSYIHANSGLDRQLRRGFDRIVYHCHSTKDLRNIRRFGNQKVRAVFVVTEDFTPEYIDKITTVVKYSSEIDELSFRQMVGSDYKPTYYCHEYLKAGHQKDWYYIEQGDYNLYYAEGEVKTKFEMYRSERSEELSGSSNERIKKIKERGNHQ